MCVGWGEGTEAGRKEKGISTFFSVSILQLTHAHSEDKSLGQGLPEGTTVECGNQTWE